MTGRDAFALARTRLAAGERLAWMHRINGMGWVMGTRWLLETEAQRINPILSILCIHANSARRTARFWAAGGDFAEITEM